MPLTNYTIWTQLTQNDAHSVNVIKYFLLHLQFKNNISFKFYVNNPIDDDSEVN